MNKPTYIETASNWIKNSVMLKLTGIAVLILLLLIPSSMVKSIIEERESLNTETMQEVSSKWANDQLINGPIITIPLTYAVQNEDKIIETTKYFHLLPDQLDITSDVTPEKLRRGIYEIVVYKSSINLKGQFKWKPQFDRENLLKINWEDAFVTIGISDLRGIEENLTLNWQGEKLEATPGSLIPTIVSSGVTVYLSNMEEKINQPIDFSLDIKLQGSQNMSFTPIGKTTTVKMTSMWPSPSFMGNFLPDERSVSAEGFTAQWKILQLNRNFPQSWMGNAYAQNMQNAAFGVDLILPLDDYQKSMRSAKYAILTIALSFLIFFLVEILNDRRIHPFQYTLVGLSLCAFYVLLISITEHTNFNFAYLISMLVTVSMISLYSLSVFKKFKLSLLLSGILLAIYGFLFVTLQLADYALLMGSIGLSLILACTMYFTRNINWYELQKTND